MKGVKFVRLCQEYVRKAKKNFWKLGKTQLNGEIISLSKKLDLPPIMVVRAILKDNGLTKKEINQALKMEIELEPELQALIKKACKWDPVYSAEGIQYSKWRGDEGENVLATWLDMLGLKYEQDLGKGLPDFVLKKPLKLFGKEVNWIESKASFGDQMERKLDEPQFKRFDAYGVGAIVYWPGYHGEFQRFLISGEKLMTLFPKELQGRVRRLLEYVPASFNHLLMQ